MSNTVKSNKTHDTRTDYTQISVDCKICKIISKQKKSKWFSSPYALKHHLSQVHDRDDEIKAGITKSEILYALAGISKALELDMLIDLPRRKMRF